MWTMREQAAFPWNFPSVWRGLRLRKHAPLSCATACASSVLPLPLAPYSSTERAAGTLKGYYAQKLHPSKKRIKNMYTSHGVRVLVIRFL